VAEPRLARNHVTFGHMDDTQIGKLEEVLVTDAAGRRVRQFSARSDPKWNLLDEPGQSVVPGVYFVELRRAGRPSISSRLIVVRCTHRKTATSLEPSPPYPRAEDLRPTGSETESSVPSRNRIAFSSFADKDSRKMCFWCSRAVPRASPIARPLAPHEKDKLRN
jgi:hypothetical protein